MSTPVAATSIAALARRFLPELGASRTTALASAVLVVAAPLATAALLWSFKLLIDEVLVGGRKDLLLAAGLAYGAAVAAKITFEFWGRRLEAETVEAINLALRAKVYRHALSLSPGSLGRMTTGDVLTRLSGDVPKAEYLVFTGPLSVLADGAAALVLLGFVMLLDWRLGLASLVVLPLIVALVARIAPAVRRASRLARRASAGWTSLAEERLDAVPVVHAYDAEEREAAAFERRAARVRRMEVLSQVLQARQSAAVETIVAVAGLAVLGLGATLIGSRSMTVGELVAFLGAVGALFSPIRSLAKAAGRFQNAAAGAQRVAELLDTESRVRERPGARSLEAVKGRIELRDVTFSYPGGQQALTGLSLSIVPGETVALVGPSGAGKSTIARLLLRQYDVESGAVLIEGIDVRDVTLASLRRAIAPVFQDANVLAGTLLDNVRYGAPDAALAAIEATMRSASVTGFAAGKAGLATAVGTSGSRLSGGQRQRVALARALLREAPILLLDEATAGVDSETEEAIQDAIAAQHGARTLIVVAHRLSSVRRADRVIVIEDGRVVEEGSPADLLSREGRCRDLFQAQLIAREAAE